MCSYFRVDIPSPSYHWWWSGFHGDTRHSWPGAWVHVLLPSSSAWECSRGGNFAGGSIALLWGLICFWAEPPLSSPMLEPHPSARDPAWKTKQVKGLTLGVQLFCCHAFLFRASPTSRHKVTICFYSQDYFSQRFPLEWRADLPQSGLPFKTWQVHMLHRSWHWVESISCATW